MSTDFSKRILIAPNVMFRAVGDESVILNLNTQLYVGADPVGTAIWAALTASDSIQSAYESLLRQFDVAPAELREDLDAFVQKLLDQELIQVIESAQVTAAASQRLG